MRECVCVFVSEIVDMLECLKLYYYFSHSHSLPSSLSLSHPNQASILAGIHNSTLWREGKAWESIESEWKKKKGRLDAFFANKNDFRTYRLATRRGDLPCVPYLGERERERMGKGQRERERKRTSEIE